MIKSVVLISVLVVLLIAIPAASCSFPGPEARNAGIPESLKTEVKNPNCDNERRLDETRELFQRLGLTYELQKHENATNVTASVDGDGNETVIVGAHYDKTDAGCGAIDNWTGVVILAFLAKWSRENGLHKNYRFVGFGGEEKGLFGSLALAEKIQNSNEKRPCAMVNLDSFGFERAWGLKSISDRPLLILAADVERKRGGSFSIRNYRGASSDSVSFQRIGIPAITFSGIGKNWRDYLHKDADQADQIDFDMIAENYRFLLDFIKEIDSVPCEALAEDR